MVRRFRRNPKAKSSSKRGGRRKPARAKLTTKAVNKLIDRKLDSRIEDKYLYDVGYTALRVGDVDDSAANYGYLREITPTFLKGNSTDDRIANKVYMKYMSIMLRHLGHNYSAGVTLSETNLNNLYPSDIPVQVHLFRMIAGQNPNVGDMDALYRRQGQWIQDIQQDADDQVQKLKAQKLKTFDFKLKYRTMFGNQEDTSSGTPVVDCVAYSIPQMGFIESHIPIKKKWLINDSTNKPMKYTYWLYIDYGSQAWRSNYDQALLTMPNIDVRFRWVFEDA